MLFLLIQCRKTLPFRASIYDYDSDPPLTNKGLKGSYHTGKQTSVYICMYSEHFCFL